MCAQYISDKNFTLVQQTAAANLPAWKPSGLLWWHFRRGAIPAVCVAIFRDNPFGIVVRDNWVLTIENGQVQDLAIAFDTCAGLFLFNELMRR